MDREFEQSQRMADEWGRLERMQYDTQRRQTEENFGYASVLFNGLMEQVRQFESGLNDEEEIGALIASFGRTVEIAITAMEYSDPHLLIFHGIDINSKERVRLVQHTTQTNLILKAVPKTDPTQAPRRIGF